MKNLGIDVSKSKINHGPDRKGDVRHSLADISKGAELIDYTPEYSFAKGIKITVDWYCKK